MNIQFYPDELDWVNATILDANNSKSFLETFCHAALRADFQNYEIIRPALLQFIEKYPARPERIAAERHDRGADI
jgi:hypothetical protein